MNPRRSSWMLASIALLLVGGLLGFHVYRLETRLAALEAPTRASAPDVSPARAARTPPAPARALRRNVKLDAGAARQVAQRLGEELGIDAGKVDGLARFLMAFHLRSALDKARARGEDVSASETSHAELLRVDLKQELLGLKLTQAQLATLSRETPGLEALVSR
ncbi:hypothetical protein [Archangium sp.]|uniref:hypothetical protein n=1 Tax=Archangium sp. TaxID=1872627 RepID=UPI00286A1B63|nr:hypothetical protein [Archangium sp.]